MAEASASTFYDFSGYWLSQSMSDLLLRITVDSGDAPAQPPPAKKARGAKQPTPAFEGEELPGHGIVLAACSPYFEAELTRWRDQKGKGRSKQHIITLHVSSQAELEAARAMLQFMYQRRLPDGASQQQLMAVLQLADKYDVQPCAAACGACLSEQELEWDTVQLMLQLPPAYSDAPLFSRLFSKASDQLQQQLGDLELAWTRSEGRERFLALPLKGIELLLGDKRTRVAYENTVLVAASLWVQQHSGSVSAEEKKRLAELIRLPYITAFAGFNLALAMPWLTEALTASVLAAGLGAAAMISGDDENDKDIFAYASANGWPASWALGKRPSSQHHKAQLEWKVSLQQVKRIYTSGKHQLSPPAEFGGLLWHVMLFCPKEEPHELRAALVHRVASSLKCWLHDAGANWPPAAIERGSISAVRPGIGAAAPVRCKQAFASIAPCILGFRAADLLATGPMPEWDPQRFEGWVGADGQLTLRMEVADFK